MASTLLSIQIIPTPPNPKESAIPYVDKAIEVIEKAGVPYRVGPLETTIEGEINQLLAIVAQIHEVLTASGCSRIHAQIKMFHTAEPITMSELTQKYD